MNDSICQPSYVDGLDNPDTYTGRGLGVTKAYIHHLVAKETVGAHLLTIHNVTYLLNLMAKAREAIVEDRYPKFVKDFFFGWYQGDKSKYPVWAIDALKIVGVDLLED